MNQDLKIKEKVMSKQKNNTISCQQALQIAEELQINPKNMSKILNELKIKIIQCQLGCF